MLPVRSVVSLVKLRGLLKGIKDIDATALDVGHVAGREYQAMNISHRGKSHIVHVLLALAQQFAPAEGYRFINGQDAALISRKDPLSSGF
jgi:hypothetical protein